MLRVVSSNSYTITGEDKLRISEDLTTLIFVVEGYAFFNKTRVDVGGGCFAPNGVDITAKTDEPAVCSFVAFELDGAEDEYGEGKLGGKGFSDEFTAFSVFMAGRMEEIVKAVGNFGYGSISEELGEALSLLLLSLVEGAESVREYGNPYVDGAIRYINGNLHNDIKVETLAAYLGVDRMYLRNLFVKYVGASTMEYIMTKRMDRAKELLKNKKMTVKAVANAVGYADPLCFSKAFKKHEGVAPSEYREELENEGRRVREQKKQVPVYIL